MRIVDYPVRNAVGDAPSPMCKIVEETPSLACTISRRSLASMLLSGQISQSSIISRRTSRKNKRRSPFEGSGALHRRATISYNYRRSFHSGDVRWPKERHPKWAEMIDTLHACFKAENLYQPLERLHAVDGRLNNVEQSDTSDLHHHGIRGNSSPIHDDFSFLVKISLSLKRCSERKRHGYSSFFRQNHHR